jgi:thiol:disulfide interchange protein DsbC
MYKYLFIIVFSAYYLNCSATEVTPSAEPSKTQDSGITILKPGQAPGQPKEAKPEAEPAKPVPAAPPVEEKPAAVKTDVVKTEVAKTDKIGETPAAIKEALQRLLRIDMDKVSLKPSVISGIYEVSVGSEVIYMTEDGHYMIIGDVRDAKTGENITEKKRSEMRLATIKSIKEADAIVFKPKETKYVVHVFTDVECPYCAKFHQEIAKLNELGIEIRYLAFPRSPEGSEDFNKMISVWCSKDRQQALTDAKSGKEIEKATCDNPVKQELEIGRNVGVSGTPALILPNGELLPGYLPADRLASYLKESAAKDAK